MRGFDKKDESGENFGRFIIFPILIFRILEHITLDQMEGGRAITINSRLVKRRNCTGQIIASLGCKSIPRDR